VDLKIIYFDLPFWRAEISRLPLFITDIKFDDVRPSGDDWDYAKENGKMKDGTIIPFRELPVLHINGESIGQTMAIARICGKLSGMYPEDIVEDILSANSSDWFVGDNMTIADLAVWSLLGWIASGVIDDISAEIIQPFEGLVSLYNKINKNPRVREWKIKTYDHDKVRDDEYSFGIPDSI